MSSQGAMLIQVRIADDLVEAIEDMYDQVTERAYEIFRERGAIGTIDLEDWLTAEQQLLIKPGVRTEETDSQVTVRIWVGEVCPVDLQVVVTPHAMLLQAENSLNGKKIFRTVEFPRRIMVNKAEARFVNGCLVLTA
jgi:HSP20 family molecular chaperone IbpA